MIGAIGSSGKPTSSSRKPKPLSASRKISSTFVQSGTSARIASRLTSSYASLPSCYGNAEMWQSRAGLGNSPRTILEELARIQSHDVVLPTATNAQIRLRCVTQPDPAQAALLDRLGVVLPKRMRLPEQELSSLACSA